MDIVTHPPTLPDQILSGLSIVARAVCVLFGVVALIGLLFFGSLTMGMLAGFLAFAAAVTPASRPGSGDRRSFSILVLATLGLMCKVADVVAYYLLYDIPGSYYAWPESIATFIALAVIALHGAITHMRQRNVV